MYSSDKLYITVSDHAALNCSQEDWDCCEAVMIGGKHEILLLINDLRAILLLEFGEHSEITYWRREAE